MSQTPSPISRRAWNTLAITSISSFMVALDTTIVAVALPSIAKDFTGTPRTTLAWVFTAYNVGLASLLLLSGKMADRYGRKSWSGVRSTTRRRCST